MISDELRNGEKTKRPEKEEKRTRKTSRFRRLSISKARSSSHKEKRYGEESQLLLTPEEDEGESEQDTTSTKKVGVPTIDEIELKEVPVYIICPKCGEKGVTRIELERSKEAECFSICLCVLQCYCCFWLPLVMRRFKNVTHTCPKCMKQIGVYKKVSFLARFSRLKTDNNEI